MKSKPRSRRVRQVCSVCGCDGTETDMEKAKRLHGRAGFMTMQALGGVGAVSGRSVLADALEAEVKK